MDIAKIGLLIRQLRREAGLTQRDLAEALHITDKAVSKWERGQGCPDVSLLSDLADFFQVSMSDILAGELPNSLPEGINMKKTNYYVCPLCGHITFSTGGALVLSCCGRKLEPLTPVPAPPEQRLTVEPYEDGYYISSPHPMTKEHFISFVAFATGESLQIFKQYPEWELQVHLPLRRHGTLLWYSAQEGMLFQRI